MTTYGQMKTLFAAVTERLPELEVVPPRRLVLKPVGQLVRGVIMDRTSSADMPNQEWFIGFSCDPTRRLTGAWDTFQPAVYDMKRWSHPRHQETFIDLLETEILPLLKSVESVADLVALRHPSEILWRYGLGGHIPRIVLHAAIGRFDVVDEEARKLLALGRRKTPFWTEETYVKVIEQLWPLAQRRNRPAVATLLHEWECEFVERHRIAHLYEPSPYSFEGKPE